MISPHGHVRSKSHDCTAITAPSGWCTLKASKVECQLIPSFEILDQTSIDTWLTPQLMLNHYDQHLRWQLIRSQQKFTDMPSGVRQPTADQVSIKALIECQLSLNQDINFHISISIETCIEHQMRVSIGTQLCKSSTLTLSENMGSATN